MCQQWYNNGHCSNPTVKNWCKKTCHGCQGLHYCSFFFFLIFFLRFKNLFNFVLSLVNLTIISKRGDWKQTFTNSYEWTSMIRSRQLSISWYYSYFIQGRPGLLGIQYIGVSNFRYTVFLCLKLGIEYSLMTNFGYKVYRVFFFLLILVFYTSFSTMFGILEALFRVFGFPIPPPPDLPCLSAVIYQYEYPSCLRWIEIFSLLAIFGQGGYPYQSGLNTLVCANVANDTQCYKWFSSGLCLNPGVRQYCRMTCGTCQG